MYLSKVAMEEDGYGMESYQIDSLQTAKKRFEQLKHIIEQAKSVSPPTTNLASAQSLDEIYKYVNDSIGYKLAQEMTSKVSYQMLRNLYGDKEQIVQYYLEFLHNPSSIDLVPEKYKSMSLEQKKWFIDRVVGSIGFCMDAVLKVYQKASLDLKRIVNGPSPIKAYIDPKFPAKPFDIFVLKSRIPDIIEQTGTRGTFDSFSIDGLFNLGIDAISKENLRSVTILVDKGMAKLEKGIRDRVKSAVAQHVASSPRAKGLDKAIEYLIGPASSKEVARNLLDGQIEDIYLAAIKRSGIAGHKDLHDKMIDEILNGNSQQIADLQSFVDAVLSKYQEKLSNEASHSQELLQLLEKKHPKTSLHKDFGTITSVSLKGIKDSAADGVNFVSSYEDGYEGDEFPTEKLTELYSSIKTNLHATKKQVIVAGIILERMLLNTEEKSDITIRNAAEKITELVKTDRFKYRHFASALDLQEVCRILEERTRKDASEAASKPDGKRTKFDYLSAFAEIMKNGNYGFTYRRTGIQNANSVIKAYYDHMFAKIEDFSLRYGKADFSKMMGPDGEYDSKKIHNDNIIHRSPEDAKLLAKKFAEEFIDFYSHIDKSLAEDEDDIDLPEEKTLLYRHSRDAWQHLPPAKRLAAADELAQSFHSEASQLGKGQGYADKKAIEWVNVLAKHPSLEKMGETALVAELFNTYMRWYRIRNSMVPNNERYFEGEDTKTSVRQVIEENIKSGIIKPAQMESVARIEQIVENNIKIPLEQERATELYSDIRNMKFIIEATYSSDGISKYISKAEPKVEEVIETPKWDTPFFRFTVLQDGDPRHFTIGAETNCCQSLGDAGQNAAIDSFINKYAGVLLLDIKYKGSWRTAYQSYFHYVPEDKSYILDNIESNNAIAKLVDTITGASAEELYAKWASEMKSRIPEIKYIALGKAYTKIRSHHFSPFSAAKDPRKFHDDIAGDEYSDFDEKNAVNLLGTEINIKEVDEEIVDDEDEEQKDLKHPWVRPLMTIFNAGMGMHPNIVEDETHKGLGKIYDELRGLLIRMAENKGKLTPGLENKSLSYIEQKLFPKKSGLNIALRKIARAFAYRKRHNI